MLCQWLGMLPVEISTYKDRQIDGRTDRQTDLLFDVSAVVDLFLSHQFLPTSVNFRRHVPRRSTQHAPSNAALTSHCSIFIAEYISETGQHLPRRCLRLEWHGHRSCEGQGQPTVKYVTVDCQCHIFQLCVGVAYEDSRFRRTRKLYNLWCKFSWNFLHWNIW